MSQSSIPPAGPARTSMVPPGLVAGHAQGIPLAGPALLQTPEAQTVLSAVKRHVAALFQWLPCMSYNDSYFGEPAGLVKREVRELGYLLGPLPAPAPVMLDGAKMSTAALIAGASEEDRVEAVYWEMDARIKGYGEWKGRPQSERDAFKWAVRNLLAG